MSNDIYSYIKENFGIEITDYQFKRDYIQYPLKKGINQYYCDKLYKEDIEYLYITLNLSQSNIAKLFNRSRSFILKYILKNNLYKSQEKQNESRKITCKLIYGYETNMQTELFKKQSKKTNLEKYGVDNPVKSNEIKEKMKNTNKEKYGVTSYSKTDECKEKMKNTNKEKYGVEWVVQSDYFKEKSKDTSIEKYGVTSYSKTNECKEKIYHTKEINKSFNISKDEKNIFNELIKIYPNTLRQYKSELYPFQCDFYIPDLDLYIEYQGYWKHGEEPYIGSDEQKEIIKLWEKKSQEINFKGELKENYNDAIYTWTIRDTLKRETAKKNNLNWIEFFNMKQFMDWYNKILENDRKL